MRNGRKISKKAVFILLFFCVLVLIPANVVRPQEKPLLAAIEVMAPCVMKSDEPYTGFEIDLWEEISKDLGLEFAYYETSMDRIFTDLIEGKAHVGFSCITITHEREELVDFTVFFAYISTSSSLKGLIVPAITLWGATGMLMFCFAPVCLADSDTLQIAVIGPMSGKDNEGGQAMLNGVNLCVDEVNKIGGINGRKLEVIAYDDQNNKVMARNKALEIAKDSKALVVIGHYYSSISLEGGKIYKLLPVQCCHGDRKKCEKLHAKEFDSLVYHHLARIHYALCISRRPAIRCANESRGDRPADCGFPEIGSSRPVTEYRVSCCPGLHVLCRLRSHPVGDCNNRGKA